ncbi:MAG: hypothetical protein ACREVK_04990 [Gammaproteobacteria bacterium]
MRLTPLLIAPLVFLYLPSQVSAGASSAGQDSESEICRYIVDHANSGELEDLIISFHQPDRAVKDKLATSSVYSMEGVVGVDMDGDGQRENIVLTYGGLRFFDLSWRHLEVGYAEEWEDTSFRWIDTQLLLRYGEKAYVLGKENEFLRYLAEFNENRRLRTLCEFAIKSSPVQAVIHSDDEALCRLALNGPLTYAPFDRPHSLTVQSIRQKGLYETSPQRRKPLV